MCISQYLMSHSFPVQISFLYFLIANAKAKLNSNGDKASPCFRPFSLGILEYKYFPILTLLSSSI